MISPLFEKNLKSQIVALLIRGDSRTARQITHLLKKKGIHVTERAVYKALNELVSQKAILNYHGDYEINPDWLSELEKDSKQALRDMLEPKALGQQAQRLGTSCLCGKGDTEAFCSSCHDLICSHCGFKEVRHVHCGVDCLNCQCGHQEGKCIKCGKSACLRCANAVWMHEYSFCKNKEKEAVIGILKVDHDCWFSNLSERYHDTMVLNSFSDKKDEYIATHSGVVRIGAKDKHKVIAALLHQRAVKEARLIHQNKETYFIRTRALMNRSVDEFTKSNGSILLNPVVALDSKEQNLILAPSMLEMRQLSHGLQEFGGMVKLLTTECFSVGKVHQIKNNRIKTFLSRVPKVELLRALQKINY